MLSVEGIRVGYGSATAVNDVTFTVAEGEVVTLVGANGAGKSSILHALSGIVRCTQGRIGFDGEDITNHPAHAIVSKGLVQVPEGRMIFTRLTVEENLRLGAHALRGVDESRLAEVEELFPVLSDRLEEPASNLSGGQLQMLALARGFMAEPKLLLLDEPSLGLDPLATREVLGMIETMRDRGVTILFVEQNVRQALMIADRAYVMENGQITIEGKASDLIQDDRLVSAYLGVTSS